MGAFDGKVTITTSERRPCWVNGRRAIFHRWIDSARPAKARGKEDDERAPHFQLYSVHGLVEYEDGTMRRVWATEIQFADSAEKFGGICWEQLEHRRDALPFTYAGLDLAGAGIVLTADCVHPANPVEKACYSCAHEDDGETADCEAATYGCKACPAWDCYCSGCNEYSKWTPKEGGA